MNHKSAMLMTAFAVVAGFVAFYKTRPQQAHKSSVEVASSKTSVAVPSDNVLPVQNLSGVDKISADATPEDHAKAQLLSQIIASKNDNDPRLDKEFNALTEGSKALLREQYQAYRLEKRNERGTVVFILGRNLQNAQDMQFLHEVLSEPPCVSMSDCQKNSGSTSSEDLHEDTGTEVSLAYPQIVALKSLERYLASPSRDPSLVAAVYRNFESAQGSRTAIVAQMAEQLMRKYAANSQKN